MTFYKISAALLALSAIHASGVITGSFANSGTVPCGGLICRPISGIFTKDPLPSGYVHVATIPAGASNISITELRNSINYLVLKSSDQKFVINGDYSVSSSGVYEAGGAIFEYQRIDGLKPKKNGEKVEGVTEWITCTGPTMEAVHLMVLGQDPNPGIKYEYLLPLYSNSESDEDFLDSTISGEADYTVGSSEDGHIALKSGDMYPDLTSNRPVERRKRRFMWKVVGFSPCSKSCSGGTQTPIIRCVREAPTRYFSPRRCAHSEKPVLNENILRCNTQPCPAYWRLEDWGDCNCAESEGYRQREVRCVQELAAGIVIQVNNAACMEEEPQTKKRCDCPKVGVRRRGHRQRLHEARASEYLVTNSSAQRRYSPYESDKGGVWLMSDWNQHCSVECGSGLEYRSIFCDRSPPNTDRCDLRTTPDTTRVCENEKNCGSGEWFTSPWSQCNGDCFNLTRTREVICIRSQLIVDDEECEPEEKPIALKNCTSDEVEYCKPRWHYSEWTECTKTCDGGTQRRSVKCLELDLRENTLKESKKCRYAEREPIYRGCNTHKCEDPRVDLIQNDIQPTCVDEFSNCHRVANSPLCSYDYYRKTCCYSCSTTDLDSL